MMNRHFIFALCTVLGFSEMCIRDRPKGADLHQEGCVTIQVALSGGATSTGDEPPVSSEDPVWDLDVYKRQPLG